MPNSDDTPPATPLSTANTTAQTTPTAALGASESRSIAANGDTLVTGCEVEAESMEEGLTICVGAGITSSGSGSSPG